MPRNPADFTAADWLMVENRPNLDEAIRAVEGIKERMPAIFAGLTEDGRTVRKELFTPQMDEVIRSFRSHRLEGAMQDISDGMNYVHRLEPLLKAMRSGRLKAPLLEKVEVLLAPDEMKKTGTKLQAGLQQADAYLSGVFVHNSDSPAATDSKPESRTSSPTWMRLTHFGWRRLICSPSR